MGKPVPPVPVKLFTGILTNDSDVYKKAQDDMVRQYGPVDFVSGPYGFDLTNYYEEEMGRDLRRYFWSFRRLIDPGNLPEVKLFTNEVEDRLGSSTGRRINLDPGYLDFHKVILASVKERAQKIYLSGGIYADPTLYYLKGRFHCYEWSLPDFRDERYYGDFMEIRERYRRDLRERVD